MSWILLSSFDLRILERIAAMEDPPALGVLSEDTVDAGLMKRLGRLRAASWNPRARILSRDQVTRVHDAGCLVLPWTILTRGDWDRVMELGADGAFCNEVRVSRPVA
jgi:glycerophosphoryl diester phosphodiesterase